LSISPIRKSENEVADTFIRRLYAMLPRLRITELFAKVHSWTGFADRFAHLRTGALPDDARALMTAVLADATNLGLTRMARSAGLSATPGYYGSPNGMCATKPIGPRSPVWSMPFTLSPARRYGATVTHRRRTASSFAPADMVKPALTTTPNMARSRV
jgi:Tn3 transposase DDE domain